MAEAVSLGIDLGGTKIEAAVLRVSNASPSAPSDFDVVLRERVQTPGDAGYEAVLHAVAQLIRETVRRAGLDLSHVPVGVGMPGATTRVDGHVKNSNTVCLNGRPFRQDLRELLGADVSFENDANCFALAEARLGAAQAYCEGIVFGVILGTGVGGGVIIAGRAWQGLQSLGGEWGHHAVGPWSKPGVAVTARELALGPRPICYCGKTGCLELYASGPAIEADYLARSGSARKLAEIVGRRADDEHAQVALDQFLEAFGRGLANVIDILDPSAVVLGGGVSNIDLLYTEGVARVAKYVFNDELLTPILKHRLGDSAGVIGAALLPLS